MLGVAALSLLRPPSLSGADTTPPTVVPQDRNDRDILHDLKGVPDSVKTLILKFDQTRDKYLKQQRDLLAELRNATTAEMRQQIRDQLQANRQDFLAELKSFREELKADLAALKDKISHAEFNRIIDAAHDAGTGHHRRGH